MLKLEQIVKLESESESKQQPSATSTISNNESRTMRSAETQTELIECSGDEGASSEDAGSAIDDELEVISMRPPTEEATDAVQKDGGRDVDDDDEDGFDDEDILGEHAKLKTIKRLNCTNLFNFNKLELLNERCTVVGTGQQQISDSSRNLCEHEMHVAIDEDLEQATAAGEGKRTRKDSTGSSSAIVFIQESPEVIL